MREVDEETRDALNRIFHAMTEGFASADARFDDVQRHVSKLEDQMLTNFDALYRRDEVRQTEYQAIKAALSRVEGSIGTLQSSVTRLESADLETRVAQLEAAARGHHDA
jgi:BMFP domain-containing protein YqiC